MINEIIEYFTKAYQINPIWQIIGLIWFILAIVATLNKCDKKMKNIHWISLIFWVVHYFLIWLYTAVAADLIWAARNFLSVKYKWNKIIIIWLIIIYIIFLIITYKNIYSFLPIVSWILVAFAFFYLEWIKMRLVLMCCSTMWLIYTYIGHSIWWMIIEIFLICANLITITRLLINKKINKFCDKSTF